MTIKLGTYEHKKLFCRMLIDGQPSGRSHSFPWPKLDPPALARLRSIPLWSDLSGRQQEGVPILSAFAESIRDPLLKDAIAQLAEEQMQQAMALTAMIGFYGLPTSAAGKPQPIGNPEAAFIRFGFQNSLDSFLGFGLFGVAQQAHYLPEAFLECFNALLDKKARHIIFFMNWWAYRNLKLKHKTDWSELRGLRAFWTRRRDLLRLMTAFDKEESEDTSADTLFSADRLMGQLTLERFLDICQLAHTQRMQTIDPDLIQPQLPVTASHVVQRVLKFWPQRVVT